jgi:hypothetical protein
MMDIIQNFGSYSVKHTVLKYTFFLHDHPLLLLYLSVTLLTTDHT